MISPGYTRHPAALVLGLGLALLVQGCATLPPPSERIERAEHALQAARDVRAEQLAAPEYERAERQLLAARDAESRRNRSQALELAELAEVNADLARARAREAAWREEAEQKEAANEALRRSLQMEGGR